MVEDRVTDGERIGQLFASELTGLERGPLESVAVTDAREATPAPGGTMAFAVAFDGRQIGRAFLFPESMAVELSGDAVRGASVRERATGADVDVAVSDGTTTITVESGAAVKRAVDALVAGLEARH